MNKSKERIKIVFLGTGTSHGIPMIGCNCRVCKSSDPHDKRTRSSLYIETNSTSILIDTSPELRLQCIENNITHIDAILFTHAHADHILGLDDVRRFSANSNHPIPCYGNKPTIDCIKKMFSYAFRDLNQDYSERPKLSAHIISSDTFRINDLDIIPLKLLHGQDEILGYRIGNIAYCTDCSFIPDQTLEKLYNLDILILDALRFTPHPTHFNVSQAIKIAQKINAKKTYFTHIAHEIKHSELSKELPQGIYLAYDNLTLFT